MIYTYTFCYIHHHDKKLHTEWIALRLINLSQKHDVSNQVRCSTWEHLIEGSLRSAIAWLCSHSVTWRIGLKEQLRLQIDERKDKNLKLESGIMYVDNCSCQIARVSLSAIQEPGRCLPIARINTGAVYINYGMNNCVQLFWDHPHLNLVISLFDTLFFFPLLS